MAKVILYMLFLLYTVDVFHCFINCADKGFYLKGIMFSLIFKALDFFDENYY